MNGFSEFRRGFTLIELCVVLLTLALLLTLLAPAFSRTEPQSKATLCRKNLRVLTSAFRGWSEDNNDLLLTCQDPPGLPGSIARSNWMRGNLDFNGGNRSNWDTNQDIKISPLFPYVGQNASVFKCPADPSSVPVSGRRLPRVRSYSLSQVLGRGEWLDGSFSSSSLVWRTYARYQEIVNPAHTFWFIEEHPDSINDCAFACACSGNQPNDPPAQARIIDIPASYHNNAANLSFADGHVETHRWIGTKIRPAMRFDGSIPLNIAAGDSWVDAHWLAANTTVKR